MEKQKRWQLYLIVAVLVITLYNILPTIFFYSKPLSSPIDAQRAQPIAETIVDRVNSLETDSQQWLASFSRLIGVKPQSIELVPGNAGFFDIAFQSEADASLFKRLLPNAGKYIPFVPAQLQLNTVSKATDPKHVLVQRNIFVTLDPKELNELTQFVPKRDANGEISADYRELAFDRVGAVALAIAGPSKNAAQLSAIAETQDKDDAAVQEATIALAKEIVDMESTLGKNSPITKRYFASFTQIQPKEGLLRKFSTQIDRTAKSVKAERDNLRKLQSEEQLDAHQSQTLDLLNSQVATLENAAAILKKNTADFEKGQTPLTWEQIQQRLATGTTKGTVQTLSLEGFDPFIKGLTLNWENNQIALVFYDDVQKLRLSEGGSETESFTRDRLNQYIVNTLARLTRLSDEKFLPAEDSFSAKLDNLNHARSYLRMNLGYLAQKRAKQIQDQITSSWAPTYSDFQRNTYPILSYDEYQKLAPEEQQLGLVIYTPAAYASAPPAGFRNNSIYVIAKGMAAIGQKFQDAPQAAENQALLADFTQLSTLLQEMGFIGYPGSSFNMAKQYSKDFIFELNGYADALLKASREDFQVKGSKRFAVLDFTDVEQRILTENKIDDRVQEDLVKWYETYQAAQADLNQSSKYTVPAPTKNVYWENFKLSSVKYFRGDDRKVLKWGLDLSGGKSVRIGLQDQNGRPVTQPDDLKQAVNELYNRINKMGVAERTIRIENSNILLDFPGAQNLSAAELVKASAMYFHIVNEKFSGAGAPLASTVNHFLQEIWNEAVVTNRTDIDSINEIAWNHLGGDTSIAGNVMPQSDNARLLYDNGLRLANPKERSVSQAFDDTLSSIAMFRGADASEWDQQANPLMIVFHNFALEGANLENVQAGYDNTEGNILTFGVKRSYEQGGGSPRDDFYTWTSRFAKDKIEGTPLDVYTRGQGWRMAVILNGSVITSPTLKAALRDGGTISGRFSQREVTQLASDLKAGSLSFTPRILSEENVSPELGHEERVKGIMASLVALVAVVAAMCAYYRFAGLVASCAVLLNIFIMWGVLQNIGAALTLPGIAGIVLTIGMAVDANVLVFERIREEFRQSGKIASAIQAGYRKAFSAIVDSNITTLIAAVILIQFDSGPIKGFAVTLIIGILSSMFTSLFMTRYFFAGWVRKPENKHLEMAQFLKETHFKFLAQTKKALIISGILIVLGAGLLTSERKTLFGMDFTGGYSLVVDLQEQASHPNYRAVAKEALQDSGAARNDFEVRELSRPTQLRIQLGTSMDEKGHPFYQMPETNTEGRFAYEYQHDPRLTWVVTALETHGLNIQPSQLTHIEKDWTMMSGQFSDSMRNNAIIALAAALLAILIYITVRFEFKYAISAVIGLAHDVVITLGILALFHLMGFAVQIDLQVIGAIMTIIGYSLNDTIIVFDRIREDQRILRRLSFSDIIDHALNVTLSRTIMTSGTTLLVLLALVLLGGQSIFAFSLVMTIGVVVGTLSSLFIAPPCLLYFHNKEVAQHKDNLSRA